MAITERGGVALVIILIFTITSSFFLVMRIVARAWVIRSFGWDDIIMVAAMPFTMASGIATYFQMYSGMGKHLVDVSMEESKSIAQSLWFSINFYMIALLCIKTSILVQYLRIFVGQRIRMTTYGLLGLTVLSSAACILGSIFSCWPIAGYWDVTIPSHCISQVSFFYYTTTTNIVTDVAILLLPVSTIWNLKIARRQKVLLMFVFSLGSVVCVVSVIRLHNLELVIRTTDPTFDLLNGAIYSSAELNIGIISACLPTIKPIVVRSFPKLFKGRSIGSSPCTNGYMPHINLANNNESLDRMAQTTAGGRSSRGTSESSNIELRSAEEGKEFDYHISVRPAPPETRRNKGGETSSERKLVM